MKKVSPNTLVQDHDEFTLSPLNDSINFHQTLSSSVKSSPQHHCQQNEKCSPCNESSERLLNIPFPSHTQEDNNKETASVENGRIFIYNIISKIDLYVISPSYSNSDSTQQQQQQQQENSNINDSLYISDDSNITLLSSPSDPLLLESSPQPFHNNNRNMNKSNSFPFYNNNNNNNNSPPLLSLSSSNLPIPFNENNDLLISNSIIDDNINGWNNDWCNNQQYCINLFFYIIDTPLLSQDFDYNLYNNNNTTINSAIDNNYTEPILLHSRKRNSIQNSMYIHLYL